MGDYIKYVIDVDLNEKIPNEYIQAIYYFAREKSLFSSIDEIKLKFPHLVTNIDEWDIFINTCSYHVEICDMHHETNFSLINTNGIWHLKNTSFTKRKLFIDFFEWLKPFILNNKQESIGYYMELSSWNSKQYIVISDDKINKVGEDNYSPVDGIVYCVGEFETTNIDEAIKYYIERIPKLNMVGFGFDSGDYELDVFVDHILTHRLFNLKHKEFSIDEIKKLLCSEKKDSR